MNSEIIIKAWGRGEDLPDPTLELYFDTFTPLSPQELQSLNTTELENKLEYTYENFDPDDVFTGLGSLFDPDPPEPTVYEHYGDLSQAVVLLDSFIEFAQLYEPIARIHPINFNPYQTLELITNVDTFFRKYPVAKKPITQYYCPVCKKVERLESTSQPRREDGNNVAKALFYRPRTNSYYMCKKCYDDTDGFAGLGSLFG